MRLRIVGRDAQNADASARGVNQTGHQIHQRGFAGTVRANQRGDARRNRQIDAIDTQNFAIEF